MKAISISEFGGPEVLQLKDVELPPLGPDDVLVKMKAAGVNPVDTIIRSGAFGGALPLTPGKDGSGVVEAVGQNVTKVAKGDRVFVYGSKTGTYAELAISPEIQVWPLPEHVSFSEGAAIGLPYGMAFRSLVQRGNAKAGDTVLIHGASGGVGLASVQMAAYLGMQVIGTASSDAGRDLVLQSGACKVYNHRDADYEEKMAKEFPGGFDVILEMLANQNLARDLRLIANLGRIVVIGSRGPTQIDAQFLMHKVCSVTGSNLYSGTPAELNEVFSAVSAALKSKQARPVVATEMSLAQASEAHKAILDHSGGAKGNIVLMMG